MIAPTVEPEQTSVVLDPAAAVPMSLHMYNPSPIVDGYAVHVPAAPDWLTVTHEEIRLLPHTDAMVPIAFGITEGTSPDAQTVAVALDIRSLTDDRKTTTATIEVTVPRFGRPVTLEAHPSIVRLTDEVRGTVLLTVDNSAANHPQSVVLTASDPEGVVDFAIEPQHLDIPPAQTMSATLTFELPTIDFGTRMERVLTVTATAGDDESETSVAVTQQRSAAPEYVPVELRLEPSVLRVRDFTMADLTLVVDNRRGAADRTLTVGGRDAESKVAFRFPTSQIRVAAGKIATLSLTVEADAPAAGEDVSYPFTVLASDEIDEVETTGTLALSTSPPAITTATLRLHPSKISVRNSATGRSKLIVDNSSSDQWLRTHLAGSDPEAAARLTIRPPTVDVPPRRSVWADVTVSADPPDPGESAERPLSFTATDGRSTVTCDGTFAQRTSDWLPIVRVVLTLLGALVAGAGAFAPWAVTLPDYLIDKLLVAQTQPGAEQIDEVAQTQPIARLAVLVLAGAMALGVFARTGKPTQTAAIAMALGFVGYMVYLTQKFGTGGPMYGAVLVVVGAVLGFLGGLCIRRR
ncbi:hypothetical protein VZC37_09930 [Gordonia sp. LSe1-13]|uniref:Uncharacterized protein n=1 Tax=Gordonia sesuvii TaxID=3116777 RepID=A0ABU7MC34_9ACTN|nr:hypothetical protein [Gordonia sp. LSe1-13]